MGESVPMLLPAEIALSMGQSVASVPVLPAAEVSLSMLVSEVAVPLMAESEIALDAGPQLTATVPELSSVTYSFRGMNALFTLISWNVSGRVKFRCRDLSGGSDKETSFTVVGMEDLAGVANLAMVSGNDYTLDYQLDAIPNVPGWSDTTWINIGINWTQPGNLDPAIEDKYDAP